MTTRRACPAPPSSAAQRRATTPPAEYPTTSTDGAPRSGRPVGRPTQPLGLGPQVARAVADRRHDDHLPALGAQRGGERVEGAGVAAVAGHEEHRAGDVLRHPATEHAGDAQRCHPGDDEQERDEGRERAPAPRAHRHSRGRIRGSYGRRLSTSALGGVDAPREDRTMTTPRVLAVAAALAAATAACWYGWLGWDHTYQVDPVTGVESGPYEAWQVVGCVVSLAAVALLAGIAARPWLPVLVVPPVFTLVWSLDAAPSDDTGLWVVGAVLILVGLVGGSSLLGFVAFAVRRLSRGRLRPAGPAGPSAA